MYSSSVNVTQPALSYEKKNAVMFKTNNLSSNSVLAFWIFTFKWVWTRNECGS